MIIDFQFKGLADVKAATQAVSQLSDALKGMPGGGLSTGGGSGGSGGSRITPPPKLPQPPDFNKALRNLVYSTRVGGSVSPLIGRTMSALDAGLGTNFAKIAGPIGVAIAAVTALGKAAQATSRAMIEFSQARGLGGGSVGQTLAAQRLSSILGTNVAADAAAWQQANIEGGFGTGYERRLGVAPQRGGAGRDPNRLKPFLDLLDKLGNEYQAGNTERVLRHLQDRGLTEYLPILQASKGVRREALAARGGTMSQADIDAAVRFQTALAKMKESLVRMGQALTPVIEAIAQVVRGVALWWRSLALIPKTLEWIMRKQMEALHIPQWLMGSSKNADNVLDAMEKGVKGWEEFMQKDFDRWTGDKSQDRNSKALDENTRALWVNTENMRRIFGGGDQAARAVPPAWRHRMLEEAMYKQSLALGAFAI